MAVDPVCNKEVDETAPAGGKAQYWGKYFCFCSKDCRINFLRDPPKYVPEIAEGRGPLYEGRSNKGDIWRS
jgi:YHS domain-containing protein